MLTLSKIKQNFIKYDEKINAIYINIKNNKNF